MKSGHVAKIDDDDFYIVRGYSWRPAAFPCGVVYAQTSVYVGRKNGRSIYRTIRMHRLLTGLKPGNKLVVDHKNGDGLDNRRQNLRVTTPQKNLLNRTLKRCGAYKTKYGWMSRIRSNGTSTYLGHFKTEAQAANAYRNAAVILHGEFTRV